jgi:hypothetical protein
MLKLLLTKLAEMLPIGNCCNYNILEVHINMMKMIMIAKDTESSNHRILELNKQIY